MTMATSSQNPELERERFRVRAIELHRRQLILQNELVSPGISGAERDYIESRVRTLSNEEDAVAQSLAQAEQRLAQSRQIAQEQEQRRPLIRRPSVTALRLQAAVNPAISRAEFQQALRLYRNKRRAREEKFGHLKAKAQKVLLVLSISVILIAILADILSIFDLGWLISGAITGFGLLIARRINRIEGSVQEIRDAQSEALDELRVLRQQLRPHLIENGLMGLFASAETLAIRQQARSYFMRFFRDQAIVQLLELVPIFDLLPGYLGSVVKMLIDQRRAYRKAKEVLVPYRQTLDLLDRLELEAIRAIVQQAGVSREFALAL